MRPSERILAVRALPELRARLDADLRAAGVDPRDAARVSDDSLSAEADIPETGCAVCGGPGHLAFLLAVLPVLALLCLSRATELRRLAHLPGLTQGAGGRDVAGFAGAPPIRPPAHAARCLRPCGVKRYVHPRPLLTWKSTAS